MSQALALTAGDSLFGEETASETFARALAPWRNASRMGVTTTLEIGTIFPLGPQGSTSLPHVQGPLPCGALPASESADRAA